MIHFSEKEVNNMSRAWEYYKSVVSSQSDFLEDEYQHLIDKLTWYQEENTC